mgnify:CR=1 FL=1
MKKLKNSKGFTLMEMLIVVAIIAILVAIAIPTFTNQLEKAREATDMANIRAAYAEVMASALTGEEGTGVTYTEAAGTWVKEVDAVQKVADWQTAGGAPTIGGVDSVVAHIAGEKWTITYNEKTATTTIG